MPFLYFNSTIHQKQLLNYYNLLDFNFPKYDSFEDRATLSNCSEKRMCDLNRWQHVNKSYNNRMQYYW